jgi:PAS domain-containing protein
MPATPELDHTETETSFQSLLESAPDAIVIVDDAGRIVLVNHQVEQLFGYDRAALIGQPVEVLLPARLRGRHTRHRGSYFLAPHTAVCATLRLHPSDMPPVGTTSGCSRGPSESR